ncbi:MAG: hypothetical protein RQ899_14805, partial [Pseudomonadales bacterium]|nr:hypothetical protein [Pseudomonadales bacterium]
MKRKIQRRQFLLDSGALLSGPVFAQSATVQSAASETGAATAILPDRHPASAMDVSRIGFGSCARQDKEQPIWDAIAAMEPDLFICLGDNIYGDTRDMQVLQDKYAALAAKPGFRRLREHTPMLAIWDARSEEEYAGVR